MIAALIFCICIVLFLIDKFPPSVVAMLGCVALVVTGSGSMADVFSGFTNDIVFIILGTELVGIACIKSGLSQLVSDLICKNIHGSNSQIIMKKLIFFLGIVAALMSAFFNNQVVSSLVLITCMSLSLRDKNINAKTITLPIIYAVILGGQCTLVGAPATLMSAAISEELIGYKMSMFSFLPIGSVVLVIGMLYLILFGVKSGNRIWGNKSNDISAELEATSGIKYETRSCVVVIVAIVTMVILFITNIVSVGMASMIAGLICILGGAIPTKTVWKDVDSNILIWLGCSIGMATSLNRSGFFDRFCSWLTDRLPSEINPIVLLVVMVILTTLFSNFIANTTTVIMMLPIAINIVNQYGYNPEPFIIAITMAAGFSVMTPLSCGFIGMTMRLGYKFKDYVKYGAGFQMVITTLVIVMSCLMYKF